MLFPSFAKMNNSKFCISKLAILALFMALSLQATIGESRKTRSMKRIKCEALEKSKCAFAVSWSGKRCVLEKTVKRGGGEAFTCQTSEIMEVKELRNRVETDECVQGCGLDRNTLGISSDSLLDARFSRALCSSRCYDHCPNVVHLFFNLAAAEGLFLPKFCKAQGGNVKGEMSEIRSSGIVASGPIQSASFSIAPVVSQGPVQFSSLSFAPALTPTANDHLY